MIESKLGIKNAQKQAKTSDSQQVITDVGTRKVCNQNFSKVIAIPKIALANLGKPTNLKIELIQDNGKKFLRLSPVGGKRS